MQVSVEIVNNIERRLTISVPVNMVEEAYTAQINRIAKQANIKGFRPGKAPMAFIQQRFGEDARKEAYSDIIQKALYDALIEKNLKPVGTPQVQPKTMLADQPFEFIASFEILPEIEKINFAMDNVEKLVVDVTNEDIEHVVTQLKKQYTRWNIVDRAAKASDRVVIDYYAIFDGKADIENKIQNFPLELGGKVMLPGFEDGLIGAKPGDERKLSLTFPADFQIKERAGQPVEFEVTVKQVFEAAAPEINEQFVQQLGVKSGKLEDLQQQIRQSLEQERNRLVRENLKEQVFRNLLEQNPMDVPRAMISHEAKNIHDEIYPQHQHHDHHSHSDDEMSTFNEIAKKRVSLGLLIAEYAKKSDIKPDTARVQLRIQEIASVYENPPEVVEWLSSDERRSGIEAQVMEDQVMDKLLSGIPTTDKTMSYAELKGIRV